MLLLLCLGTELSRTFGVLCAQICGAAQVTACPTFCLARSTLPKVHWLAVIPESPLRYWKLIDIGAGSEVTNSPLRIDERVANYLIGMPSVDQRLEGVVMVGMQQMPILPVSHQKIAKQVAITGVDLPPAPVVQLCGNDGVTKGVIALAISGVVLWVRPRFISMVIR